MPYGKHFARFASQMPAVLILHEKHDNAYFHIPDLDVLARRSVEILKYRRDVLNYYAKPGGERPKKPFEEAVETLPAALQEVAREKIKAWKREARLWDEDNAEWVEINEAINKGDGVAAWEVLRRRSDAEYERVELRSYDAPYRA